MTAAAPPPAGIAGAALEWLRGVSDAATAAVGLPPTTPWWLLALAGAALAFAVAFAAARALDRAWRRLRAAGPELDARFPGLRGRIGLYRRASKAVLYALAAIVALEAWGAGPPAPVLESAATVALTLALAAAGWEFASAAIARALSAAETARDPARGPGSRARTLLPLARRAVFVALAAVAGLTVLSEVGVDITPLLAGAGIVGVAVGFGSQALVRDIVTGAFILAEDTISVGDWVTVAGHTGEVEDLSIRAIRLRDLAGTVHTVPFGAVTTVENLTRDRAHAIIDIGVAYREDIDRVCEVLEALGGELRADPEWAGYIRGPMEVLGVEQLADSAVVIRCRVETEPLWQWAVRRAFLKLAKKRFDELGIEIPFPHATVYFGADREGNAPAARLRLENGPPAAPPGPADGGAPPSRDPGVRP